MILETNKIISHTTWMGEEVYEGHSGYKNLVHIESVSLEDAYKIAHEKSYDYFVQIMDKKHVFIAGRIPIFDVGDYPESDPLHIRGGGIEYEGSHRERSYTFLSLPIGSTLFFKGGNTADLLKRLGLEHQQYGPEFAKLYQL